MRLQFKSFRLLHRKGNPLAFHIDLQSFDFNMLMQFDNLSRVADVFVCKFTDMNQSVLFHTNINKSAKTGKIGDRTGNDHSGI